MLQTGFPIHTTQTISGNEDEGSGRRSRSRCHILWKQNCVHLQTEVRRSILKANYRAVEMCASYQKLLDPCQALQFRRDRSNPSEICQRFWRSNLIFETSLTRLTDINRNRSPRYLYDSERVNHDVLIVDVRNSRRKIERDKRGIHPECVK